LLAYAFKVDALFFIYLSNLVLFLVFYKIKSKSIFTIKINLFGL
jgi:hypothetical protein